MIISLHMPKTAGSSFRFFLRDQFQDAVYFDYNDSPDHLSKEEIREKLQFYKACYYGFKKFYFLYRKKQCIHGHFLAAKYGFYKNDKNIFVTWLRDPLERLGSHYYYWQRSYHPTRSKPLHKRVIEEKWSFERFCFSGEMQNLYSRYIIGFPMENFDFIGIVENFEEDFSYFVNKYLGLEKMEIEVVNSNPNPRASYFQDIPFYRELRDYHQKDYEFYNYALELREKRTKIGGDLI